MRHYPLGSNRSCEENLANTQELIHRATFVRDGVESNIRPPTFCITLNFNLFCRVLLETWRRQLWLALFSSFSTQDPLHLPVFFQKFSHRKSLGLLFALQQQRWVLVSYLILCWCHLSQLRAAIDEYTITSVRQDRPFKYNTYSKVYTQFVGMQAKIDANSKHAALTQKLRIHWATTGRWVKSTHSYYIFWFVSVYHLWTVTIWLQARTTSTLFWIKAHLMLIGYLSYSCFVITCSFD